MNLRNAVLLVIVVSAAVFAVSCSKDKDKPEPQKPLQTVLVKDLPADPTTRDPNTGAVIGGTNQYTFFRFSDSSVVANSDSAGGQWDIGVRGTSIIMNSGVNGPGQVAGQAVNSIMADVTEAPQTGYEADAAGGDVFAGWYNYNMQEHVVTPKPGFIFLIHTHDNKYVKMEVISYYQGAPAQPTLQNVSGYYTFRYVLQPDGSRSFEDKN